MVKKTKDKMISIGLLLLAFLQISVCFAAYSGSLKILGETYVKPNSSTFKIVFSSEKGKVVTNPVKPSKSSNDFEAKDAIISNEQIPTISGLQAKFTKPGQYVIYKFYVRNVGEYHAYLKKIDYKNVDGSSKNKVCTSDKLTDTQLEKVCSNINVSVKVDNLDEVNKTTNNLNDRLSVNTGEEVVVIVEYDEKAVAPKEAFNVYFGNIELNYNAYEK